MHTYGYKCMDVWICECMSSWMYSCMNVGRWVARYVGRWVYMYHICTQMTSCLHTCWTRMAQDKLDRLEKVILRATKTPSLAFWLRWGAPVTGLSYLPRQGGCLVVNLSWGWSIAGPLAGFLYKPGLNGLRSCPTTGKTAHAGLQLLLVLPSA